MKNSNIEINRSQTYNEPYSVILAISRERGVELVDIQKKSINKRKFKMFLERLRQLNLFNDITLMMDNVSFHKSGDIRQRMDELGFQYTYTPVYSP